MDHVLPLLLGSALIGLGVLVGRNNQTLSGRVRGTWVFPRTVEARDGIVLLMGLFCVVAGVVCVCVGIAQMM
jgi:hypothetical protein